MHDTDRKPAVNAGIPHHDGSERKGRRAGRKADTATGYGGHALLKFRLEPRLPEKFTAGDGTVLELTEGNLRHLSLQATNLMRNCGVKKEFTLRCFNDIRDAMKELLEADENVRIYGDKESGRIELNTTRTICIPESFTALELSPADHLRPELAELVKRFIFTVTDIHGIGPIYTSGYFEYALENLSDEIQMADENGLDKEDLETLQELKDEFEKHDGNGTLRKEVERLKALPPLTPAELDAFSPTPDEEPLLELLKDGSRFLTEKFDLSDFRLYGYGDFYREAEDTFFTVDESYFICEEYDEVCDRLYDIINNEYECGVTMEPLVEFITVPEEGDIRIEHGYIEEYFAFLDRLCQYDRMVNIIRYNNGRLDAAA